jgi:hypothetical protein
MIAAGWRSQAAPRMRKDRFCMSPDKRLIPLQTTQTAAEIPLTNWKLLDAVPWKIFNAD